VSFAGSLSLPLLQRGAGSFALKKPETESVEALFARVAPSFDGGALKTPMLHPKVKSRAVFMSDFHLGTASCAADKIVQFLDHVDTEYLYLVGDIIDCWQIRGLDLFKIHGQNRNQTHVLQKIIKLERQGVKIVYIPGNHDEYFRDKVNKGLPVNNLAVLFEATHDTADGRRILVMHGDSFDEIVRSRWLSVFGTHLYEYAVRLSARVDKWRARASINRLFRPFGFREEWSLAQELRDASTEATYRDSYEKAAISYLLTKNADIDAWNNANPQGIPLKRYDEILCGHTHIPCRKIIMASRAPEEAKAKTSIVISNTGCWIARPHEESYTKKTKKRHPDCTAVIEKCNGSLQHVQWVPKVGIVPVYPRSDGHFDNLAAEDLCAESNELRRSA
jgi:UDP-2,3-diacylglucosamine pyrophosphatase LpxH